MCEQLGILEQHPYHIVVVILFFDKSGHFPKLNVVVDALTESLFRFVRPLSEDSLPPVEDVA